MTVLFVDERFDDDARRERLRGVIAPVPLADAATAISSFGTRSVGSVYVETDGDRFRWSPAHSGGIVPLHRKVATYLGCEPSDAIVRCATVAEWAIVRRSEGFLPVRWKVLAEASESAAVLDALAPDAEWNSLEM